MGWESQHSWVPPTLRPSQSYNQGVSWDHSIVISREKEWEGICFEAHSQGCWQDLVPCGALGRWHRQFLAPWISPQRHNMAACYTRANKTRTREKEPGQDDSASLLQPNLGSLFTLEAVATRPSSRSRGGSHRIIPVDANSHNNPWEPSQKPPITVSFSSLTAYPITHRGQQDGKIT